MDMQLLELNEIISVCEDMIKRIQDIGPLRTGDDKYEEYKNLISAFCNKYDIKRNPSKLIHTTYLAIDDYYWSGNYSVDIVEANNILELIESLKTLLYPNLFEKIFISHREKDKAQADALIELLYVIGIPRPLQNRESMIFCSSHPAAYVENGRMIDEEILKQFHSRKNCIFILWYTDNYFESQACLNEMGAVWVMGKPYQEILAPGFDRAKIGGLLPKTKLSFYADDKFRLNTFKEQIEEMFNLQPINTNAWEVARDRFINTITHLSSLEKEVQNCLRQ